MTRSGRHSRARRAQRSGGWPSATGVVRMTRLNLRTGWVGLLLAALASGALVGAVMRSVTDLYGTAEERTTYAATLGQSPATAAFNGRPYDLDRVGGIAVYEVGFFGLLLLPAIAMVLAIRHSRQQEDIGRADLVTSMRVGRLAPLLAAMTVTAAMVLVGAAIVVPIALQAGFETTGTLRYAAMLALYTMLTSGIAFVAGEVCQSARSAYALGFGVLFLIYLVRAVIDGRKWDLGWTTPMGWLAESRPFSDDPPLWPAVAMVGATCLLLASAVVVRTRRDLGGGLISPRTGPAVGHVRGPVAIAWRVTGGTALAWMTGAVAWGFAVGLLAQEMRQLLDSNPTLSRALLGEAETPDSVMTYIAAVLIALMGAAVAVQGMTRMAAEESSGRIGLLLSTSLRRTRLCVAVVAVICLQVIVTLAAGGMSFGIAAAVTGMDASVLGDGLGATLGYLPAAVLIGAVTFLLLGVSPRLAGLGWIVLVWATLVALLADTLQLPGWVRDISPLELTGDLPMTDLDPAKWLAMLGAGLLLGLVAAARISRRDLVAG